jgi:hypothetical protein
VPGIFRYADADFFNENCYLITSFCFGPNEFYDDEFKTESLAIENNELVMTVSYCGYYKDYDLSVRNSRRNEDVIPLVFSIPKIESVNSFSFRENIEAEDGTITTRQVQHYTLRHLK